MIFRDVALHTPTAILPPTVLTTEEIEERLRPVYGRLGITVPQIEALTGVRERRIHDSPVGVGAQAAEAGIAALKAAGLTGADVDMVLFCGVCRDNLEPAGACEVAEAISCRPRAQVMDISNACLGMLNGIILAATAIDAGLIRTALVTSAESSRAIIDSTLDRLIANPTQDLYRKSLATMTGGSGASAIVVRRASDAPAGTHRVLAAAVRTEPGHHRLCRWGPETGLLGETPNVMFTDAAAVLSNGVALGKATFQDLEGLLHWGGTDRRPKTVCHQVGSIHRQAILAAMGIPAENDFVTFEYLGNMGTVSLPITAALGEQRRHLLPGDRVAFCGIGSGLNCISIGLEW
jgi:3-oxoacyl-[acyl-carrier-protein] synthase-3